ncbi:MAG: hypothetical protein NTY48_02850 [Candidatus Diapherotrites archaeon]|nr:hypothetical protein [Candidatus Diapherotrites archaeon]
MSVFTSVSDNVFSVSQSQVFDESQGRIFNEKQDQIFNENNSQFYNNYYSSCDLRQNTIKSNLNDEITFSFMEKERIEFPKGKQKEFIAYAKKLSGKSWRKAAELSEINYNTFQNYWKENTRLSKKDFEKVCAILNLDCDTILAEFGGRNINYVPNFSVRKNGAEAGIKLFSSKIVLLAPNISYPNKSLLLDCKKTEFSRIDLKKDIFLPEKVTPLLAEETGCNLGDGFLSSRKYEYRLKGNKNNEKEYYEKTVRPMFKELYNLNLNIKMYETTIGFELYSKAICEFKNKVLGIQRGPKRDICVPEVFKVNDLEILCALLRGLFDTDGNIYFRAKGENKNYYPVVTVTTSCRRLAKDVYEIMQMLGFKPRFYESKKLTKKVPNKNFSVRLNGYKNFELYKKFIGTKQPKNINKIERWEKNFPNFC